MLIYVTGLLVFAGIYALLAAGLNLQWGHTGLVNLGHVAFFAIGAYTTALLSQAGVPLWLTLLPAVAAAAAAAYPIGRITLRLQEDYLAIVTFGFAEVLRQILSNERWSGATNGIPGIPVLVGDVGPLRHPLTAALVLALVVVVLVALRSLIESPYGRVLRAIRDDEGALRSVGKSPEGFRVTSLVVGSGIAGLAGWAYAHYIGFIAPDQFAPTLTFTVWTGVILGGSSLLGGTLGTLLFVMLLESTRFVSILGLPIGAAQLAQIRLLIVGVSLIVLMHIRPEGLMPYRHRQRFVRDGPTN
jgi:branched-chain amino acid transport system permease protein